ncbi:MAG: hypothetical protein AB7K09_14405 [Planctomycetota bacterium]
MGELTRYQIQLEDSSEVGGRMQLLRRVISRGGPGAALVPVRYLRRIQRVRHASVPAAGSVPHEQCLALSLADLTQLIESEQLVIDTRGMSDPAVLVAEPTLTELESIGDDAARRWLLSFEYHARIDHALDGWQAKAGDDAWTPVLDALGADTVEEARNVLRNEARLVDAGSDHELMRELVASVLQFRVFEPALLRPWFPGLDADALVAAVEALPGVPDLSLKTLMGESGFDIAEPWTAGKYHPVVNNDGTDMTVGKPVAPTDRSGTRTQRRADHQAAIGNLARAILLRQRVARKQAGPDAPPELDPEAAAHLDTFCNQLVAASGATGGSPTTDEWRAALGPLVMRIGDAVWPEAAKLLFDLQKACVDFTRPGYRFSLLDGIFTAFRQPMMRELTWQVSARVHGHLRSALHRAHRIKPDETRLSDDERNRLEHTIDAAREVAEKRLRSAYRPVLIATLGESGFVPKSVPETVALEKLVEWLLDRIAERDYIGFGDLRDALSLSDLKMTDVDTVREAVFGDSLLIADRLLNQRLPGVYRRGPVYMRLLQRTSSIAFGTPPGRFITRFFALPVVAAYVLLEGSQHIIHLFTGGGGHGAADAVPAEVAGGAVDAAQHVAQTQPDMVAASAAGVHSAAGAAAHGADAAHHAAASGIDFVNYWSIGITAVVILALIESATLRNLAWQGLRYVGIALKFITWDWLSAVFHLRLVRYLMVSRFVRVGLRNIAIPAIVVWGASAPIRRDVHLEDWQFVLVLVGIYTATWLLLHVRFVQLIEALVQEQMSVWWERARKHLLPNIIRWIFEVFRAFIQAFEYLTYTVDEALRFRRGDNRVALVFKVGTGMLWAIVMYVITLYVTLLIEPQINPIKHFPVVTVSHKIMLPIYPDLIRYVTPLCTKVLGDYIGYPFAAATLFLLPGVFGFLAWELTSNWRLYVATRPRDLQSVLVGSHGERVSGMLRPGFHSGPVPRLWRRIRRSGMQDYHHGRRVEPRHADLEHLHHISDAIEHFISRDLLGLLRRTQHLHGLRLRVGHPTITTSMARVPIVELPLEASGDSHASASHDAHGHGEHPLFLALTFVERAGRLVAIVEAGTAGELAGESRDELRDALVGICRKADADAVAGSPDVADEQPIDELDLPWLRWTERWKAPVGSTAKPQAIAPTTLALLR